MTITIASNIGPARITMAYERLGDPSAPPVVLIMGLGAQLIGWPDGFCDELVTRGLHVIRFDNRDVGESTHFTGMPNFPAVLAGDHSSVVYTLRDMAGDTIGLFDELGLDSVHLVGASMGGFIAQVVAIEQPRRVRSLTSMLSSTGSLAVGQPRPESRGLFAPMPPRNRAEAIERALQGAKIVGSPGFPPDLDAVAARAGRAFDRGFDPPAMIRQGAGVVASGDRTSRLRELRVPTLVIHGDSDVLVDVSGGHATAAAIPGAELVVVEGLGHDLPRALWSDFASRIAAVVARGEGK